MARKQHRPPQQFLGNREELRAALRLQRRFDPTIRPPTPKTRIPPPDAKRHGPRPTATVMYRGAQTPIRDLARSRGIPPQRLYARLKLGWDLERALSTPNRRPPRPKPPEELSALRADAGLPPFPEPRPPSKHVPNKAPRGHPVTVLIKYGGAGPQPLRDVARANGIAYQVLYSRLIQRKWPLERAISQPLTRQGPK